MGQERHDGDREDYIRHTHSEYLATHSLSFQIFLFLILFICYAKIIDELKDVLRLCDFVYSFPVDRNIKGLPPSVDGYHSALSQRLLSTPQPEVKEEVSDEEETKVEDILELEDGMVRIQRISRNL